MISSMGTHVGRSLRSSCGGWGWGWVPSAPVSALGKAGTADTCAAQLLLLHWLLLLLVADHQPLVVGEAAQDVDLPLAAQHVH